jgi:hypothetical protein
VSNLAKNFCPYCGNPIKPKDKYCIICGKPLLSDLPKKEKEDAEKKVQQDIERAKKGEVASAEGGEGSSSTIFGEQKTKKGAGAVPFVEGEEGEEEDGEEEKEEEKEDIEEPIQEAKPLPEDVKRQVELYAEYSDLQFEKEKLLNKLDEVSEMMDDEKYDIDYDYKNKVNIKFKAVKEIIKEKKEKEKELEKKMNDTFIIQKLNNQIDAKVYQLKNLTREYRLKKLDKDTFKKLKNRYKKTKESLEKERAELKEGLRMWLQELIVEKNDLQGELALYKGRYKSKEIDEEEYESKKEELEYQLKKTEAKIETVEKLTE